VYHLGQAANKSATLNTKVILKKNRTILLIPWVQDTILIYFCLKSNVVFKIYENRQQSMVHLLP
jgi:hypothetical protein